MLGTTSMSAFSWSSSSIEKMPAPVWGSALPISNEILTIRTGAIVLALGSLTDIDKARDPFVAGKA